MKQEKNIFRCDVITLHHLLGKKWVYGLLFNLCATPQSYNHLYKLTKRQINPSLLSMHLKALEEFQLVRKIKNKRTMRYASTPQGERLKKMLVEIKKLVENLEHHIPDECRENNCTACASFRRTD